MDGNEPPDGGYNNVVASQDSEISKRSVKRPSSSNDVVDLASKRPSNIPAAASVQHTYTIPEFAENSKLKYSASDVSPFIVHVSKVESEQPSGSSLRLLKFAQFLHKNSVSGITKDGIKSSGRNRVVVEFDDANSANTFIDNPVLVQHNYKAIIPSFHITRMGIVRNIPVDWTLEEFVDAIECPRSTCRVIKARRLNRKELKDGKTMWIPTQTVVLTFLGQKLPEKIFCYHTSLPVHIYTLPTIQCNKCCRFGHIKIQCRSKDRCFKCAQPHSAETCSVLENQATCLLCSGPHFAINSSLCPEHQRQKCIKLTMSEENIPYSEASARFRPVRRTFADTARSPSLSASTPTRPVMSPLTPRADPSSISKSQNQSYRKTVFIDRSPRPASSPGYDKYSHGNLTKHPLSIQPNGCALNGQSSDSIVGSKDEYIKNLISSLSDIVKQLNVVLPNNVALKALNISSILDSNNGYSSPMELQECSP